MSTANTRQSTTVRWHNSELANDAGHPIVSDSERANEVRSALARSKDNTIV
jgi:hypothetical protein